MQLTLNGKSALRRISLLFSLVLVLVMLQVPAQQQAHAEVCPTYDFQSIFYADYYPDKRWETSSGMRVITWSANASVIKQEIVSRTFTPEEFEWIRSAFQSWDDALDTVKFSEITQSDQAEIVIGYTALADKPEKAYAVWSASWPGGWRVTATLRLKASLTNWFSDKNQFIHAVQHELGNILGLGDIKPTTEFTSTQEDTWQPPYGPIPLSDYDTGMIRQLYGESTCPSTFRNPEVRAAAELKAKQQADAKAAAELKAKQEAEAKAVATLKKTTIICLKGKLSKKVTAVKPKCPTGYKLKK